VSLTVTNLNVSYNKTNIIDNLSFTLENNKVVAIIGKNGSGKSTTLKAIEGLIDKKGSIIYNNIDIDNISLKEKAKIISYLPQDRETPAISAYLMVEHGRFPYLGLTKVLSKKDEEIINKAISDVNIENLKHKKLDEMSGGEVQKVYLASTLAQESKVILLDEPTSHLDLKSQIDILSLINKIKEDKTILIVLHDLLQAFTYTDYIILINDGKKVLEGKPSDIYNSNVIKEVFGFTLEKEVNSNSLYPYKIVK